MNEFSTLTDEELALVEHLYESPTWAAFKKILMGRQRVLEMASVEIMKRDYQTELPITARFLAQRAVEYEDFNQVMDNKFNPPEEEKEPQGKPKSFHELLP